MTSKYQFQCFEKLPSDIIEQNLTKAEIEAIKKDIKNPFLKAWIAIHEGETSIRSVDGEVLNIDWTKEAVQNAPLYKNIKFYEAHNADNSTSNRIGWGQLVKSFLTKIGGKLARVVIGAFPEDKKEEVKKKDVISMEFQADPERMLRVPDLEKGMKFIGEKIEQITAIALGNSETDQPGFPLAHQLAELQAFTGTESENKNSHQNQDKGKNKMPENAQEIKITEGWIYSNMEAILAALPETVVRKWVEQNKNIGPSNLFVEDRIIPKWVEADEKAGKRGHYKDGDRIIRKALNESLEKSEKLEDALKAKESELQVQTKLIAQHKAIPQVEEFVNKFSFPDSFKTHLKSNINLLDMEKLSRNPSDAISEFVRVNFDNEAKVLTRYKSPEEIEKMKTDWFSEKKQEKDEKKGSGGSNQGKPSLFNTNKEKEDPDDISKFLPGDDD